MKLKMRLLSTITLTGMVMTSGVGQAGGQPTAGMNVSPVLTGLEGTATAVVNQDQVAGKWKQFKGELKKKWGEFTDDDLLAIEGSVDKLEGKIQERYGDRREEVKQWVDEWFDANKNTKEAS
jgi:uncharacterized protein YjbJ (UPF0337 family)